MTHKWNAHTRKKIESTPKTNQINNRKNPLIIVFLSQYGFFVPSTFWKSIWIYEYYILPRVYMYESVHRHTFRQFSESYLVLKIYHSDIHPHPHRLQTVFSHSILLQQSSNSICTAPYQRSPNNNNNDERSRKHSKFPDKYLNWFHTNHYFVGWCACILPAFLSSRFFCACVCLLSFVSP